MSVAESLAIVSILLVLGWWVRQWIVPEPGKPWAEVLQRLAQRYCGYTGRAQNGHRAAYFDYQVGEASAAVAVCRGRWNRAWSTEVAVCGPPCRAGLVVLPRTQANVDVPQGMMRLDTSRDELLGRFCVLVSKEPPPGQVVCDEVRWRIEALRQFLPSAPWELRFADGELVVRKQHPLEQFHQLERFVELVLACYESLLAASTEDTQSQIELRPLLSTQPSCPVCLQRIDPRDKHQHVCKRCGTRHHEDCWRFNGGCAAFGCSR